MKLPVVLAMSLTVLSSLASPIVRRDDENNILIGYYDGLKFRTVLIPLLKGRQRNPTKRYIESKELDDLTNIYYAEILRGPPGLECFFETGDNYLPVFTNEEPFIPYYGHAENIDKVHCSENTGTETETDDPPRFVQIDIPSPDLDPE